MNYSVVINKINDGRYSFLLIDRSQIQISKQIFSLLSRGDDDEEHNDSDGL